jgi:hypothetical protein
MAGVAMGKAPGRGVQKFLGNFYIDILLGLKAGQEAAYPR